MDVIQMQCHPRQALVILPTPKNNKSYLIKLNIFVKFSFKNQAN